MKRMITFLLVIVLATFCGLTSLAEIRSLASDPAGLRAYQQDLDAIATAIHSGAATGFVTKSGIRNIASIVRAATDTPQAAAPQVEVRNRTMIVSGGINYIDSPEAYEAIILENDAVLLNFQGNVNTLIARGTSEYYALEGTYTKYTNLENESRAYMLGAYGDRVTAVDQSEVCFYDRANFLELIIANSATGALLGQASISNCLLQTGAVLFDPNSRIGKLVEQANVVGGASSGQKTRQYVDARTAALLEKYPQRIIDWVFSNPYTGAGATSLTPCPCGVCNCKNPCAANSRCCEKCALVYIQHIDQLPIVR